MPSVKTIKRLIRLQSHFELKLSTHIRRGWAVPSQLCKLLEHLLNDLRHPDGRDTSLKPATGPPRDARQVDNQFPPLDPKLLPCCPRCGNPVDPTFTHSPGHYVPVVATDEGEEGDTLPKTP